MDALIGSFPQTDLEEIRVHLKKLKGRDVWDIRAYASLKNGEEKIPTGKGVAIDLRQWGRLKELMQETEDQLKKNS